MDAVTETPVSSCCLSQREALPSPPGGCCPTEDSECEFTRSVKPLGRIKETLWAVKNWLTCSSLSLPLGKSLWFSSTQETSSEKVWTSDT